MTFVIPGPSEARSPESITTVVWKLHFGANTACLVVMDSGPADFVRVPE
jgi:hypothetical protein